MGKRLTPVLLRKRGTPRPNDSILAHFRWMLTMEGAARESTAAPEAMIVGVADEDVRENLSKQRKPVISLRITTRRELSDQTQN